MTVTDGIFRLALDLKNHKDTNANLTIGYELIGHSGRVVATGEKNVSMKSKGMVTVTFERQLPDVETWTSEVPNLYKLMMIVRRMVKQARWCHLMWGSVVLKSRK